MPVIGLSALALVLAATPEQKAACLAAYDSAQQLRIERKLKAAREKLAFCSRAECPAVIRNDCVQWMSEVVASLPSIVIAAHDENGKDLVAVRVSVDGARVMDKLDGRALTLDPGIHQLEYERLDVPVVHREQVVVREGERNRMLSVTLAPALQPAAAAAAPTPVSAPAVEQPPPRSRRPSPLTWVFGALGLGAGGVALYLDLKASSDATTLRNTCAPFCEAADVEAARLKYTLAWVALGVGVVLVVAAVITFVATFS